MARYMFYGILNGPAGTTIAVVAVPHPPVIVMFEEDGEPYYEGAIMQYRDDAEGEDEATVHVSPIFFDFIYRRCKQISRETAEKINPDVVAMADALDAERTETERYDYHNQQEQERSA